MICVELSFTADPARLAARPDHRQRLRAWHDQGTLLLAGPWDDDSGALLVFAAEAATVRRLMAEDPYFTTPGVRVVSLRAWRPLVGSDRPGTL
ncbi:YciI family protein [Micromonospora sp. NPDC002389]|uniref:YciI family protein n=1 Tax=unclassified Micromonospora TaxID=2617518 RepID=UPI00331C85D3